MKCAECGTQTNNAVQVCAVCGAPAVARPSTAVDPTPETCLTCGTVTAEHLPGCPAEATVKRPRRWRVAALVALLAPGALLAVAGKLDHLHGRWVIVAGWVRVGCAAIPGIAVMRRFAAENSGTRRSEKSSSILAGEATSDLSAGVDATSLGWA